MQNGKINPHAIKFPIICNYINFISCNKTKTDFVHMKNLKNVTISQNFEHMKEQF